jgi:hypothetical protein
MKNLKYFFVLLMIFFVASCTKDEMFSSSDSFPDDAGLLKSSQAKLKIAVVSDIHYMDPSLLPEDVANNPYFQYYLAKDPKLIELSDPIFREVISELITEKPDVLLIPGDLTKDGELICHTSVAGLLQELAGTGTKVFVVPGNHDINNPEALSFHGDFPLPVATITPEEFASIYGDFGYNDALYRDDNSLSYIAQLSENQWLLAIDACKYDNNTGPSSDVSGAIKAATMSWIQEKMAIARENGISVLAMMHHGIMEHYTGQNSVDPGYVIENPQENAVALMEAGLKLMFTGHYHANDIAEFPYKGKILTDIETGSLVTPLSPYRVMVLDDNFIKIDTRHVMAIDAEMPGGMSFLSYSNLFLSSHLDGYFNWVLVNNFGVPEVVAAIAAPLFRKATMAHFAGDEKMPPAERKNINALAQIAPGFLPNALYSLWTDLPPTDNKIHIKLK